MAHRVVIVGGGFGGLYAARALGKAPVELTLIDRRNFHLFQPLLYQVATGALSPAEIAYPLRNILRKQANTQVLLGEVVDLDPEKRLVRLYDGATVPYDTLIVATGAESSYFKNPEWEEIAPGLKTIEDATRIRHRVLFAFEAAERELDPERRRAWLTFLVVGGGPTGVELAGALGEIANDVLRGDFRSIRPSDSRIILLEGNDRLLTAFDPDLSAKAEKSLIGLGVRTRTRVRVTAIDPEGVSIDSERGHERIDARTVLWAAGVRGTPLADKIAACTQAPLDRGRRLKVQPDCSLPGHPEIFVIGDLASLTDANGRQVPGVSPAAMQEGRYVAKAIANRLAGVQTSPFRYFDKGILAVIGRAAAVAQFPHLRFSGVIAWLLWLFVHLMYLVNFQNRLVVFIRWGFAYLSYNRNARLITGPVEIKPGDIHAIPDALVPGSAAGDRQQRGGTAG